MVRLALVMIAKDEARCIGRALASAAPHVDRMVVLDTGSADDTVAIAEAHGAEVHRFAWCEDFAAARNAAIARVDADWVLVLDADEWIEEGTTALGPESLPASPSAPFVGLVRVRSAIAPNGAEPTLAASWIPRVLPRGVAYEGRVHEQPVSNLPQRRVPLMIGHDGYLPEQLAAKGGRNAGLLERELADRPDDPYLWFQLGKERQVRGQAQEAAEAFVQAYNACPPEAPFRHALVVRAIPALKDAGRPDDARALADVEIAAFGQSPDFFFVVGDLYLELASREPDRAIKDHLPVAEFAWKKCLEIGERDELDSSVRGRGGYMAAHNLAVMYETVGLDAQAAEYRALSEQLKAGGSGEIPRPAAAPPRPLLSLCLATHNRARYLPRYLDHHLGVLDEAGIDYEVVVSDNCSTDETPEILARYAADHPRIRVTRQPRNVGAHPNILTTLHQARGELVVSISDDDLAVPEQLVAYVRRMAEDPSLVMIQAPWLLTDETRGGAVIGQFYELEGETRFPRGQYAACLGYVLKHHIFPECWILRRSALASVVGPTPRFAYSYFAMLANALGKGDVLFCPEPHILATAVSAGAEGHVGNAEAMDSWDLYRGGIELLASFARQSNPALLSDPAALGSAVQGFVHQRMAVAARLQAHAGNWSNAYQILRRLHAYGAAPRLEVEPNDVAVLAAVETALVEAAQLGAEEIVVGASVPDNVLARMRPVPGARFVRPDAPRAEGVRRAYCTARGDAGVEVREGDVVLDLGAAMDRFPLFDLAAAAGRAAA